MLAETRQRFLQEYGTVRASEQRGAEDPNWYFELPYRDVSGRLAWQWEIRGRTWRYFENRILPRFEQALACPLRVLDLGAGNCWMSWRLASRGHMPIAIDIFSDPRDGLGASHHYTERIAFPVIETEFDVLPLAASSADLAIFNASLHYSSDYERTLVEMKRVLKPGGAVVIMDSPLYRRAEHGRRMVEERKRRYEQTYGFASDAQRSIEYLDEETLASLAAKLGIRWTIHQPWYGLRWHARPLRAWLRRERPPSRFCIIIGEISS